MAGRRAFSRVAPKRRTSWQGSNITLAATTGASTASAIVFEAILETFPNPTIVRVRGEVLVVLTARGANVSDTILTCGIKLVTATAFAAGVASMETPNTDVGRDWLWWGTKAVSMLTAQPVATDSDGEMITTRLAIDSKAMRKVESNKVLVFVAENTVITSTATLVITGGVRVLLKA